MEEIIVCRCGHLKRFHHLDEVIINESTIICAHEQCCDCKCTKFEEDRRLEDRRKK